MPRSRCAKEQPARIRGRFCRRLSPSSCLHVFYVRARARMCVWQRTAEGQTHVDTVDCLPGWFEALGDDFGEKLAAIKVCTGQMVFG